ncbi:ESX secretion-associated protein EspG [Saccharopolyspora sp. TS4A08]|uniref:ESX secretion-associated protein EspG n=1 Tax=Saccharopolyspora ipomoeae TaxID=3042027 RepID=A0ABT6PS98_9PSEU|nr:ESX secretion-associated protein EspG [Saccharopolyspora sp. TS4A08]MDI2030880.1 ESX secretion-associated protein EspG [Saccharopolyspora sp. TS4A08]
MTNPDFVLSTAEFDLVWSALGLGRIPHPLEVPSLGATMEERAELADEVFRSLARRGLATGRELDPRLVDLLRLLVEHDTSVDVIGHRDRPILALAAVARRSGVLAELDGNELRLTEIRPTSLAMSAVGVLPPCEQGQQRAISIPADALTKALAEDADDPFGGDVDEDVALVKAGLSPQDAATVLELANNRRAGGQFGVSRGTRRATTLVTWFDTHQGRYLMVKQGEWLSIAPADNQRIEHRLADVVSAVA